MQIGLKGPFASWAAILIRPSQRILLVAENAGCAQEARTRLARVGVENVAGYVLGDKQQWQQHGLAPAGLPIHPYEYASSAPRADASPQLIDVRSRPEWLKGHLPGTISMPLLELRGQTALLDPSRPILAYSREEYRATIAASILLRERAGDIGILTGSASKWQADNMPLEAPRESLSNRL